ncbi:MAG: LuxR C-terminal-related transcriptional regulator [Rikenellaceae bacterium]
MTKRIHIIVAEPSAIIRCGIVNILQQIPSLNIEIAQVADVTTINTVAYRKTPDLLIVNSSHMGVFSPSQIRNEVNNEDLKIIALQNAFTEQSLLQNYDQVISIYDSPESITEKIHEVTLQEIDNQAKKELSTREKEIIVCVVKGMTNKQIADSLCLSTHTVIAHRRNMVNKLQIHSPSGLTIYAIVNKLVDLADIKGSISSSKEL